MSASFGSTKFASSVRLLQRLLDQLLDEVLAMPSCVSGEPSIDNSGKLAPASVGA